MLLAMGGFSCAPTKPASTQPLAWPYDLPGLPSFAKVSDGLYRGGQPTLRGFQQLKKMGIRTIVDLRGKSHRDELDDPGLRYVHIPSSASHIDELSVIAFMRVVRDPANQPVFVHDLGGGERASCYVAVFRIVEQGWSRADAKAELANFHYDPYWKSIASYIDQLDPRKLRAAVTQPPTSQKAARAGGPNANEPAGTFIAWSGW